MKTTINRNELLQILNNKRDNAMHWANYYEEKKEFDSYFRCKNRVNTYSEIIRLITDEEEFKFWLELTKEETM